MILGINANNHNASVAVVDGNDIIFAAESERYSRIKGDNHLNTGLLNDALNGTKPEQIIWYENPLKKNIRMLFTGQYVFTDVRKYLKKYNLDNIPIKYSPHHESHAAMGYYTSSFDDALIIVADAVGEFESLTVWKGHNSNMKKLHTVYYPTSIGMFYSAMTKFVDLKPNEEEYIFMGMAAYGKPLYKQLILDDFFNKGQPVDLHRGIGSWYKNNTLDPSKKFDIAASAQSILEDYIFNIIKKYQKISSNLVLSGGVFMNCVLNQKISDSKIFNNVHVASNPTDSGLATGAILARNKKHININSLSLGHDIQKKLSHSDIAEYIIQHKICGLATGRAEFGSRALGNRSILADPRDHNIKNIVNGVKGREQFRPFAPIILDEYAKMYFGINQNQNCRFMQFAPSCRYPTKFPAIVHCDGSSRIQTIGKNGSDIRKILEIFYARTGCPMLLNTSLNVKGEPLVNTIYDALRFQQLTGVHVF